MISKELDHSGPVDHMATVTLKVALFTPLMKPVLVPRLVNSCTNNKQSVIDIPHLLSGNKEMKG